MFDRAKRDHLRRAKGVPDSATTSLPDANILKDSPAYAWLTDWRRIKAIVQS